MATDIRVSLEFPDEFLIFEVPDIADVKEPKMPPMPKNPIREAEREYERRLNPIADMVHRMALSVLNYGGIKPLSANLLSGMGMPSTESLDIEEHAVDIRSKQIQY